LSHEIAKIQKMKSCSFSFPPKRVSDCCLAPNKQFINCIMARSSYIRRDTLCWICRVLVHWNDIPRIDVSLHSDTLYWFRVNQSLLFLLHVAGFEADII